MKLVVINGNVRHGSTWNCVEVLKTELVRLTDVEVTEFSLPRDMPHFCNGCFSCILNGEQTCPHAEKVTPIVKAMEEADGIVLSSPVYAMDVSGGMKALLDHLCFMWMSHRPNPKMFGKVGLVVSTAAGAGLSHTAKTLKNSLVFWGLRRVFIFKKAVSALCWSDVSEKRKKDIQRKMAVLAKQFDRAVKHEDKLSPTLFTRFFFTLMKGMMRKNTWNLRDRSHWEAQGWLGKGKPY